MNISRDVIAAGPMAEWIYQESIRKGNSPAMAEMLALRKAPSAETDDTYLANFGTLLQQFDGDERAVQAHIEKCQKFHGFTPRENDVYIPTLAQSPGDPRAHIRSRGEAQRYAEEIGVELQINGRTVTKNREPERDPWEGPPILKESIIRESAPDMLKENPKLANRPNELREAIIDKHAMK